MWACYHLINPLLLGILVFSFFKWGILVSGVHCGLLIYIKNTLWHWNRLCTECTVLTQELTRSQWSWRPYYHVLISRVHLSAHSPHLTPRNHDLECCNPLFFSFTEHESLNVVFPVFELYLKVPRLCVLTRHFWFTYADVRSPTLHLLL